MSQVDVSRRRFLRNAAIGSSALVLGLNASGTLLAASGADAKAAQLNPFVIIDEEGIVSVLIKHFEMGQGTTTGLTTLVAEELDADWSAVQSEFAPANDALYKNLFFGFQGTGGSNAIANSWQQYRQAGAMARDLLVRAAADTWGVAAADVSVDNGVIKSGSRTGHFGQFVAKAATLQPAENVAIKTPDQFKLIGQQVLPRKDSSAKTDGTATFAMDVQLPGMLYAVILRSPKFGGSLKTFDASAAKKVKGFVDAKALANGSGVAIFGKNSWSAIKARKAIVADWDFSKAETRSTAAVESAMREQVMSPEFQARELTTETVAPVVDAASATVEANYTFPYLAHAPMEPMVCVFEPTESGVRIHDGCQQPGVVKPAVAAVLQLEPEKVEIKTLYAGGSFGRRGTADADYQVEAAMAYAALDKKVPVKVFWTREDDIHGGKYRPMAVHSARIGLDEKGSITAWDHRVMANSIIKGTLFEPYLVKDGVDGTTVEGLADSHYSLGQFSVGVSDLKSPVSVLWLRSVGHNHTAYVMETMLDQVAEKAGKDPLELRLSLLDQAEKPQQRLAGVINAVRKLSGWEAGDKRGFAVHTSFESYVAMVADVSVSKDKKVHVNKLYVAVDCGVAVNPDVIRAQMEGGAGYGLGLVMRDEITFEDGAVVQSNFPDYQPLRMADMPEVEVVIVESNEAPTGVGEPGVPPVGPAVANAIYAQTGERIVELPMTRQGFSFV